MKSVLLSFVLFCVFQLVSAQNYIVKGQLENAKKEPIEYATVKALEVETGTLLNGVVSDHEGRFYLEIDTRNVYLEVGFLGFETKRIEDLEFKNGQLDLGIVQLNSGSETLDEVVLTAERSTTEFKLDKRVFNVGQDLSNTGASALEVLNNVPSVNVNIEGQINLRGSGGVQVLIDGKPSVIASEQGNALGTITADMIQSIEVITNPSAKYEAEGTTGIINIILKKEEKKGVNGSISLNTGIPHNHSLGFSINKRTSKWNLFAQGGAGYRELPRFSENTNRDKVRNTQIYTDGTEYRNEQFYNLTLGTDYHINPWNVITLSGSFAYEEEDQPSDTYFEYTNEVGEVEQIWSRQEVTEATNPKLQYELQYKKDFRGHDKHDLILSAIGNYFGKDQSSEFTINPLKGNLDENDQRTATEFEEGKYTFKLDYTKPLQDKWRFETGAQYVLNNVGNEFLVENRVNSSFQIDSNLTNHFEYTQNVLGIYGTTAFEGDRWGVKVGLRVENTELRTFLVNTAERNAQNFTDFFPTLHTSYKVSENLSFQMGYSRRIYRPRLWDLNPFFNIRNNFSIWAGNPNLLPEYTDSYEGGVIFVQDIFSSNLNLYYRNTTDVIERVLTFEDNVSLFQPYNLGTSNTTGVEFNFKIRPSKVLSFNGDLNYNHFRRDGNFDGQSFDFQGDQWMAKLSSKWKIKKPMDIEITTRYESREVTLQGEIEDRLFVDLGWRYKVLNGKAVISLSVRDLFASRIFINEANQADFFIRTRRYRGRFVRLGLSYGFGKGEAMEYTGRRR